MDVIILRESSSRHDIRREIKFLVLLGKKPLENHQDLLAALEGHFPTIETERSWVGVIQQWRISVEEGSRPGRPETACGDATIAVVKTAIEEDKLAGR